MRADRSLVRGLKQQILLMNLWEKLTFVEFSICQVLC